MKNNTLYFLSLSPWYSASNKSIPKDSLVKIIITENRFETVCLSSCFFSHLFLLKKDHITKINFVGWVGFQQILTPNLSWGWFGLWQYIKRNHVRYLLILCSRLSFIYNILFCRKNDEYPILMNIRSEPPTLIGLRTCWSCTQSPQAGSQGHPDLFLDY
jgi:hypothetical protein